MCYKTVLVRLTSLGTINPMATGTCMTLKSFSAVTQKTSKCVRASCVVFTNIRQTFVDVLVTMFTGKASRTRTRKRTLCISTGRTSITGIGQTFVFIDRTIFSRPPLVTITCVWPKCVSAMLMDQTSIRWTEIKWSNWLNTHKKQYQIQLSFVIIDTDIYTWYILTLQTEAICSWYYLFPPLCFTYILLFHFPIIL